MPLKACKLASRHCYKKQVDAELTPEEAAELDRYEEIDDYLSFVNRTVRNPYLNSSSPTPL